MTGLTERQRDWCLCSLLVLIIGVLYGALQNGQWVLGDSDDAYYLAIGRSLATGRGYQWNGAPVLLVPPGWPLVLAAAMRMSYSFAVINLVPMVLCLAAISIWYWILRRFTTPGRAFFVALSTGILFEWHRASFHHYSEGLFFFLLASCILVAFQINEKKSLTWRVPLLIFLCAMLVMVRWAALLALPIIAGVLIHGNIRPKLTRQWLVMLLSVAVIIGVFFCLRHALIAIAMYQKDEALTAERITWVKKVLAQDSRRMSRIIGSMKGKFFEEISISGRWLSRLLWPPVSVVASRKPLRLFVNVVGWILIFFFMIRLWKGIRLREWLWVGVLLYSGAFIVIWASPAGRYLAPVAPLLLLGTWQGSEILGSIPKSRVLSKLGRTIMIIAFVGTLLCNLAIMGVNVWVVRSDRFCSLCLAGEYAELMNVAQYLNEHKVLDGQLAIHVRYAETSRPRDNAWTLRVVHFLTGKLIRIVPQEVCQAPSDKRIAEWANNEGVKYILTRPRTLVSRAWHFRMSSVRRKNAGPQANPTDPYYLLYMINGNKILKVNLDNVTNGLREIPAVGCVHWMPNQSGFTQRYFVWSCLFGTIWPTYCTTCGSLEQ